MTADVWHEDARGIWQSQESVVTRMSADDMRARAERWNWEFGRTNWIAFACAAFFLAFFLLMLAINHTPVQRAGALLGIVAAIYAAGAGFRIASRRGSKTARRACAPTRCSCNAATPADMAAARTILMAMTGCALLSSPGNWMAWTLQAVTQAGTGVIAYMYITRQARRFQVRIDELTRLNAAD